jgi:putative FmdB family regulatory protein
MPRYDYACKDCGFRFETTQSFKDDPLTVCPNCGGSIYRVIGASGVIFKGSGFYVTDNRSGTKNPANAKKTDGDTSSTSTETATESKTETKTESKTEAKPAPAAASSTAAD